MKIFTRIAFTFFAFAFASGLSFGQEILWGGPGDPNGEFDGGLNDWTVNAVVQPLALWEWQADADADEGAYTGAESMINSPSASNGAAVFNSDFYDNGGDPNGIGMGPAPSPHNCELISPIIDLTGQQYITVEFNQAYRNFQTTTSVVWSNDGGMTWPDTIIVNERVVSGESVPTNDRQVVHLPGAGGTNQFRFKFVFDGDYYFWVIDDVSVIVRPDHDLAIGDFFYPPASFEQPVSQIATDTFGFFVDISNYGKVPASDINVKAQVLDGNDVLFEDEFVVPELAAETLDTTIDLTELFAPELTTGGYDIRYEVSNADTDYTPNDNDRGANFIVSSNRYRKEDGNGDYEVAFQPGGGGNYYVGNLYQTSNDWVEQYQVVSTGFAAAYNGGTGAAAGNTVSVYLSKVNDNIDGAFDNFDVADLNVSSHPDLTLRGFGQYTYGNEASFQNVNAALEDLGDFEGEGVLLEPGARYFLFLEYVDEASSMFQVFNQRIDYFQISTVTVSNDWFFGGFGPENAARIRMNLGLYSTTDENALPDESLTVFPNPVQNELNIGIQLEETSLVNVTLADLDGKVIEIDEIKDVNKTMRQYDVSDLPSGTYLVRLATEYGTKTKKFIVAR